jgi:hypothetical protein
MNIGEQEDRGWPGESGYVTGQVLYADGGLGLV